MMVSEDVPDVLAPEDVPSLKNAAKIVKEGNDVTLVAYQRSLAIAQQAVAEFEAETGKTVEIIDPRVLIPFDKEKMFASLKKTGRLVVSHDAPERGGFRQPDHRMGCRRAWNRNEEQSCCCMRQEHRYPVQQSGADGCSSGCRYQGWPYEI
jgi:Pyruvate/2-oxoglutarate dehydrogenase complex, dehydrogenase (E1) component, eukaryotic type, beta subunit